MSRMSRFLRAMAAFVVAIELVAAGCDSPEQPSPSRQPADGYFSELWGPIGLGASGPDVWQIQQWLNAAGHQVPVDGVFGATTDTAVRAFQSKASLDPDGLVGPKGWPKLHDA